MKYEKILVENILFHHLPIEPVSMEYATRIKRGSLPPPIRVAKRKDGLYELKDGRHRLCAHFLTGRSKILAQFKESPVKEEYQKDKDKYRRRGLPPRYKE